MGRRRLLQACFVMLLVGFARLASAQTRSMAARLYFDSGMARLQFSVEPAFTPEFQKRLASGLTSRAVLAIELSDDRGTIVALRQRRCELRLDVWGDQVYVRIQDDQRVRRGIAARTDEALQACGQVDVAMVPPQELTKPDGYRIQVRVALNPISPELLERSRQFTSNPRGTTSVRPQAFFGAVARLFRSELDAGGTVFVFKSGPLARPSLAGRTP